MDLACSVALGILVLGLSIAYAVRVAQRGPAHHARVEQEGSSAILTKGSMEMLCWWAQPIVTVFAKLRISPDAVTYGALFLGIAAGVSLAAGHFGLGALLAVAAAGGDAIDGLLARRLGVGSVAGEVLDATVDRYVDFALLAGLAFYFRDRAGHFVAALLALLAAFMVSYSTAKAQALHVTPPRGSMRRVERAVLVITATWLTPLAATFDERWRELPVLVALVTIAVVGNGSAIQRIASVRAIVRERDATAE
jgi:CDP-diacylglycerol--glycerol-3-phosphate 3-phosphatidyltransferase